MKQTCSSIVSISFRLALNGVGSGTFSSTSLYNRSATANVVIISARICLLSRSARIIFQIYHLNERFFHIPIFGWNPTIAQSVINALSNIAICCPGSKLDVIFE
jgi:hypothetical protein